jgi:hypothetical protein
MPLLLFLGIFAQPFRSAKKKPYRVSLRVSGGARCVNLLLVFHLSPSHLHSRISHTQLIPQTGTLGLPGHAIKGIYGEVRNSYGDNSGGERMGHKYGRKTKGDDVFS